MGKKIILLFLILLSFDLLSQSVYKNSEKARYAFAKVIIPHLLKVTER